MEERREEEGRLREKPDDHGIRCDLPRLHFDQLGCVVHNTHTRSMPQGLHSHSIPLLPTQTAEQNMT